MRSASRSCSKLLVRDAIGLPKLFETPGSHGGGIHGGDVGIGQQREQLQALQRADAMGQQGSGGGIVQIARIHDGRKIEMMFDQKLNRALFLRGHLNALAGGARELDRETRVVAALNAFAGVVKEQGKAQQCEVSISE
jgi:hypothetical protein